MEDAVTDTDISDLLITLYNKGKLAPLQQYPDLDESSIGQKITVFSPAIFIGGLYCLIAGLITTDVLSANNNYIRDMFQQ